MRRTVGTHSRHLCTTSSAVLLLQTSCPRLPGNQEEEEEERGGGVFCRGPEPTEEGAQHIEQNSHAEEEADSKARGKVLREVGRGFQSSNAVMNEENAHRRRVLAGEPQTTPPLMWFWCFNDTDSRTKTRNLITL